MGYVKLRFQPLSRFSELFTADQLWGQMVWAVSDLHGEEAATTFVDAFKEKPPFLISAMMLDGYLPTPCLTHASVSSSEHQKIEKHNKKCAWVSLTDFSLLQQGTNVFFTKEFPLDVQEKIREVTEVHVSINRKTFTAEDGGLYNQQVMDSHIPLCAYVRYLDDENLWQEKIGEVVAYWNKIGLGGDKNVGKGQFLIDQLSLTEQEKSIFAFSQGNCFMTLSKTFGNDLVPLFYQVEVYEGIVGGGWGENGRYYRKKPILQFLPGSLFKSGVGSLAQKMSIEPRICTYGYAMPVPILLEDKS